MLTPESFASSPDRNQFAMLYSMESGTGSGVKRNIESLERVEPSMNAPKKNPTDSTGTDSEPMDPAESETLREEIRGETTEHANPPRIEDEGQSGG